MITAKEKEIAKIDRELAEIEFRRAGALKNENRHPLVKAFIRQCDEKIKRLNLRKNLITENTKNNEEIKFS